MFLKQKAKNFACKFLTIIEKSPRNMDFDTKLDESTLGLLNNYDF